VKVKSFERQNIPDDEINDFIKDKKVIDIKVTFSNRAKGTVLHKTLCCSNNV